MSWLTDLQETFQILLDRMASERWQTSSDEKKARVLIVTLLRTLLQGKAASLNLLTTPERITQSNLPTAILMLDAFLVQLASVPFAQTFGIETLRKMLPHLFATCSTGNTLAKSWEIHAIPKGSLFSANVPKCLIPDTKQNSFENLLKRLAQYAHDGFNALGGFERAFSELKNEFTQLSIGEENLTENLDILTLLSNAINLARIYRKTGNLENAIALYEWILLIQIKIKKPDLIIANRRMTLGITYFKVKKYEDAKNNLQQALPIQETQAQSSNAHASILFYLAETLLKLDEDINTAENYYQQALQIRESQTDSNARHIMRIYLGLAQAREMLAKSPALIAQDYQSALNASSHADEPELVEIHTGLANILLLFQSYEAAKQHFNRALDISQRLHQLPEDRIKAWTGLANTLVAMKKFNAAKKIYDRILHSLNGQESPLLAVILTHYANLMILLKEFSIGEQLLLRALGLAKHHYRENSPVIAAVDHHLGELYIDLAHFECAKKYLKHSLAIKESFYKKNHPKYAITQRALAWVNYKENQLQQASSLMQEAHAVFVQNNMPQQYITQRALAEIQSALATQQNAAQPCYLLRLFGCVPAARRETPAAVYDTPQPRTADH